MATFTTSGVYAHVIEDVINKIRDEFVGDDGPGEGILNELQRLWEIKMLQAGAILDPIDPSATQRAVTDILFTANHVHDLNVPYRSEEYETPTADMLFPPTPLPGTAQTPLPGMVGDGGSLYNIPTGGTPFTPSEYAPANGNGGIMNVTVEPGRPSPYMQPPSSWRNQRPPLDVNLAFVDGQEESDLAGLNQDSFMNSGKRKREGFPQNNQAGRYIPQQDGAGDLPLDKVVQRVQLSTLGASPRPAQVDGPLGDAYDDALSTPNIYNCQGAVNGDHNTVNTPAPSDTPAATPAPNQNVSVDDGDDETLNEADDEDSDDAGDGDDLNTSHLVLAQFDKVGRTKNRWKCTLRDGIMHIDNKDILFNRATGEFDF